MLATEKLVRETVKTFLSFFTQPSASSTVSFQKCAGLGGGRIGNDQTRWVLEKAESFKAAGKAKKITEREAPPFPDSNVSLQIWKGNAAA